MWYNANTIKQAIVAELGIQAEQVKVEAWPEATLRLLEFRGCGTLHDLTHVGTYVSEVGGDGRKVIVDPQPRHALEGETWVELDGKFAVELTYTVGRLGMEPTVKVWLRNCPQPPAVVAKFAAYLREEMRSV